MDEELEEWCTVRLPENCIVKDILNSLLRERRIASLEAYDLISQDNDIPVSYRI